ncbi:MAG: HlyC/CorC family transporter [Actinobacteria bacterium]|nr:HlyC/CorC family transporter [Actinomycetota bacterium]MBI3687441.1 HlyC/CorC family transporter [Actinomycetota bacterium]
MNGTLVNVGIVLALILVEAIFVAAEIALISLRDGQVRRLATQGRRGVAVARLVSDPNRYLATVQIGVTMTALLSSAFGAITLSEDLQRLLVRHNLPDGVAGFAAIVGVTLAISFVTLVIGELAPKRLALQRAEGTARLVASSLDRMAGLVRPVIWLLSKTTDIVVRTLGGDPGANREAISEDELRGLVAAHEALSRDERRIIDHVFGAADRPVSEVMIPRTEVDFLDAGTTVSRALKQALRSARSRYPVVGRNTDDVIGFVHIRDLLAPTHPAGRAATVGDVSRDVPRLPGSKRVLAALSELRREGHHLAIVVDEYGGTDGIVTLEDLIEEVVGDIRDEYDSRPVRTGRLASGEYDIDGLCNLDDFAEQTGIQLPDGPYETVAGWMMRALGRLPALGDTVVADGLWVTVVELDGRRVSRLRASLDPAAAPTSDPPDAAVGTPPGHSDEPGVTRERGPIGEMDPARPIGHAAR